MIFVRAIQKWVLFLALLLSLPAPAIAGTGTAGDPYTSLTEAYAAPSSGRYFFNLGSGVFEASVDITEGGGWVLVLQYEHAANTNPPLAVLGAGTNLPLMSSGVFGNDGSLSPARWGHAGNAAMSQFTGDIETRWFGRSANSSRIIHFRTSIGDDYFRTGTGSMVGVASSSTDLTGGTGLLPRFSDNYYTNQGDFAFTNFPFFRGNFFHWGIRGAALGADPVATGTRWESDDFANGSQFATVHRVWVRRANPGVVTNTNDSGEGSLRDAINYANLRPGADTISFAIPGSGPHVITVSSALPELTDAGTSIDARTQSGSQCRDIWIGAAHTLRVQLTGPSGTTGLRLGGASQAVRGLAITGFSDKIETLATSTSATIQCNYLGLATDGSGSGTSGNGVRVRGAGGRIGGLNAGEGNVIGTNFVGVLTSANSTDTSVQGNFIGIDPSGISARPNQRAINNNNGSATWRDITRNLIAGNTVGAIMLETDDLITGSNGQIAIQRNVIGFTRTQNTLLQNGNFGGINFPNGTISNVLIGGDAATQGNLISAAIDAINITGSSSITIRGNTIARAGSRGVFLTNVTGVTIGGALAGQGNIIGANTSSGIDIGGGSSNITIQGNTLGPATVGATSGNNGGNGIRLEDVSNVSIGNGLASGRNVIGGNGWRAIDINGTVTNISISGNYLGTDSSGNVAVANGANLPGLLKDAISLDGGVVATNISVTNNVIGGYSAALLEFSSSSVDGAVIRGNNFGIGANGTSQIVTGSLEDLIIMGGNPSAYSNITIGGSVAGQGNLIAFGNQSGIGINSTGSNIQIIGNTIRNNTRNGITLTGTTRAAVVGNAIFNNGLLGIDLNNDGVTANDAGDGDAGPNDLLNNPVFNVVNIAGGNQLGYDFNLDVPAHAQGYRIDFFKNTLADDTEGQVPLGSISVAHAGGNLKFNGLFTASTTIAEGDRITATTSRIAASGFDISSEFSIKRSVVARGVLGTTISGSVIDVTGLGAFNIPGNDQLINANVANATGLPSDNIEIILSIADNAEFFFGDIDGAGPQTNPVTFDGTNAPGVTVSYPGDVRFSNAASPPVYAGCNYTPVAGYDPQVSYICVKPQGTMPGGDPNPSFDIRFRQRVP